MTSNNSEDWSKQLFDDFLAEGITLFPYVPDAGNKGLINHVEAHNDARAILLTTEEEGIALCAAAIWAQPGISMMRNQICWKTFSIAPMPARTIRMNWPGSTGSFIKQSIRRLIIAT